MFPGVIPCRRCPCSKNVNDSYRRMVQKIFFFYSPAVSILGLYFVVRALSNIFLNCPTISCATGFLNTESSARPV